MIAIVTGAGSGMGSQMVRHIVTDKVKVDENDLKPVWKDDAHKYPMNSALLSPLMAPK